MDMVAYLICFTVVMLELFGKGDPDPIIFSASIIGLGLCSIAGAINSFRDWRKK